MKMVRLLFVSLCVFVCSCSHAETKEISAEKVIQTLKKGSSVQFVNKIILTDLNFADVQNEQLFSGTTLQNVIQGNVAFVNCVFMGKISTNASKTIDDKQIGVQTKFMQNVIFQNCDFRGEVNFDNAIVQGFLDFSETKFRKSASFNNLAVWSKDATFANILAEDNFNMIYSQFAGNLYLSNAEFQKQLMMQETSICGKFMAINCKTERASFEMLSVHGKSLFNYASFALGVQFDMARFADDVEFIEVNFGENTDLEKIFRDAHFYGNITLATDKVIPCKNTFRELSK